MDHETWKEVLKNAEACAKRVTVPLENNDLTSDDEEHRTETLDTIQTDMGFLMQCIAVHPRVLESSDSAQNACSVAKSAVRHYSEEPERLLIAQAA